MTDLKVGVMGCSSFAQRAMIPALVECAATELICVASRSAEKAKEVAAIFGCEAITGYENLLQCSNINAIYMPLPTGLHEEWCIKALRVGKHLLVEKSLAENYQSAERIINAARENNCLVFENFQFQTHSQWQEVKKYMDSGVIGKVHLIRSTFGFPPLPKDNFRWKKDLGGGALLDAGAYMAKAAQLLLGQGLEILGASLQYDKETGVDKYGEAMFRNADGQVAQVAFGFDYYYQCILELLGTKGKLSTNRIFTAPPGYEPVFCLEADGEVEEILLPPDNHYVNMWNSFAGELRNRQFDRHWGVILDQAKLLDRIKACAEEYCHLTGR